MILVVGQNSVWQHTYFLPPISLGKVNRVNEALFSAAGKGTNTSRALSALHRDHLLLAYVGGRNGDKYVDACMADGINLSSCRISGETRTCVTLIENGGEITEIVESAPEAEQIHFEQYEQMYRAAIGEAEMLVVAGTALTGEPETKYRLFTELAHEHGVPVLMDSYRTHGREALNASPEILKINDVELGELSQMPVETQEARYEACAFLAERYGLSWVIVTLGSDGAEGFERGAYYSCEPPQVDVANTIGSGDVFAAGVAIGFGVETPASIQTALETGVALASANCATWKPGHVDVDQYQKMQERVNCTQIR